MTVTAKQGARWPAESGTGRGRSHGTSSSEPFDRWFRYPAGFASDYVTMLLDNLGLGEGAVVDCFAGSGVTGTAARARGLDFIGLQAHPLIAELAVLKLVPPRPPASSVTSPSRWPTAPGSPGRRWQRWGRRTWSSAASRLTPCRR